MKKIICLGKVYFILMKYRIHEVLLSLPIPNFLRAILTLCSSIIPNKYRDLSYGKRLKLALIELGPMYVKFGQMLSTRMDLLPPEVSAELATLQDNVPGFSGDIATKMIEQQLGKTIEELFLKFNKVPCASASIAQVHDALLEDGTKVVVKILRPNIHSIMEKDISVLITIASFAHKFSAKARRFKVVEIANELKSSLQNELDLVRDAANCAQLKRNFNNSPLLYVPKVYWDLTTSGVMVMEKLHGVPVSDIKTLKANNVNLKKLSERGVEIFYTQVFRDCFFHADMHPGNVWVDITNPDEPSYLALDFGIIGTLNNDDQRYLAENFIAFFNRDYRRVAELHVESGWVNPNTRIDEFESAIRSVCEPIFERPLKDISFGKTLMRLFQTAKSFDMEIQPQLILLQKTLINVEGLGRTLYPDLDLWSTAKPFLESWMKKQFGPRSFLKRVRKMTPFWLNIAPELPGLAYQALKNSQVRPNESRNKSNLFSVIITIVITGLCTFIAVNLKDIDIATPLLSALFLICSAAAFFVGKRDNL